MKAKKHLQELNYIADLYEEVALVPVFPKFNEEKRQKWRDGFQTGKKQGIKAGRKQREEEIINLLEEANSGKTHSASGSCGLCQAIELIKGEK